MSALPKQYAWLKAIGTLPRLVQEGLKLHGVLEVQGRGNNADIMAWARETGCDRQGFVGDAVPWCGLFLAVVAKRADKVGPKWPLAALNWSTFGTDAGQPCLGDVLVFTRNGGGHVGIYIAEDKEYYHVLGGNQGNAVTIKRIAKIRLYRARKPEMKIPPRSRKPYIVAANGAVSTNEA
jgi:uncharacterized protein (TIGR02594 family)